MYCLDMFCPSATFWGTGCCFSAPVQPLQQSTMSWHRLNALTSILGLRGSYWGRSEGTCPTMPMDVSGVWTGTLMADSYTPRNIYILYGNIRLHLIWDGRWAKLIGVLFPGPLGRCFAFGRMDAPFGRSMRDSSQLSKLPFFFSLFSLFKHRYHYQWVWMMTSAWAAIRWPCTASRWASAYHSWSLVRTHSVWSLILSDFHWPLSLASDPTRPRPPQLALHTPATSP